MTTATLNITREDIYGSYSITDLRSKKQELQDLLQIYSFSEYEIMEIKNLISTINHRVQLMHELLAS